MGHFLKSISKAKFVAIDTETCDPNLKELGPGTIRGDAYIVGISYAWEENGIVQTAYDPSPAGNKEELKDFLKNTKAKLIFHNAMYDLDHLMSFLNISEREIVKCYDTMVIEALIDENKFRYNLDSVAEKYLNEKKDEEKLKAKAKILGIDPKSEMYKLPAEDVHIYAEKDAELTLRVFQEQRKEVKKQNLMQIVELETKLQKVLLAMRYKGIRFDTEKAKSNLAEVKGILNNLWNIVNHNFGDISVDKEADIERIYKFMGVEIQYTEKGSVKTDAETLESYNHEGLSAIAAIRKWKKVSDKLEELLQFEINGRIHPNLNQTRSDDGGTVTGRFSSVKPNLQNIPARDEETVKYVRPLFLPEKGEKWAQIDYSQQEPVLLMHFAKLMNLTGIDKIHAEYQKGIRVDFHTLTADIVGIARKLIKAVSLGIMYGRGKRSVGVELGIDLPETEKLFHEYKAKLPFVDEISRIATQRASLKGEVRTILGRVRHFDAWVPHGMKSKVPAKQYKKAVELTKDKSNKDWYGKSLIRAETHKALNAIIQGSGSDMIKKALIDCYEAGYVASISVHDENDFSIGSKKDLIEVRNIHRDVLPMLTFPIYIDVEVGENWHEVKEIDIGE